MQHLRSNDDLALPIEQHMTNNQIATYRNHNGSSARYDMISIFSLRPPELIGVFTNPIDYFRLCYIEKVPLKAQNIYNLLNDDISTCSWIDCLGRHVQIRVLGKSEILNIIQNNLQLLQNNSLLTEKDEFNIAMNEFILDMISTNELLPNQSMKFFYQDDTEILPVPVVSNISPKNTQHFLTHIILSLGHYETEIDALCHASFRECLQSVKLIGSDTDEDSRKMDSKQLLLKYIQEQLVFSPCLLNKAETYIVMAKGIFDDAIIHNEMSLNELPPYSMAVIRSNKTDENIQYWSSFVKSQVHSIYSSIPVSERIPSKDDILKATRDTPIFWDPITSFAQYPNQSLESFNEQKQAIALNVKQINKYKTTTGQASRTYTQNIITYGSPGSGKSFIGQISVLYAIAQGLNVISTALMGVRANNLGGIHIHKVFPFPTNNQSSSQPFRCAEYAMQKIKRNTKLQHALLTVDILFFDELGQISGQQMSAIDIILRKERESQVPFGGVLLLGSMDHVQIQPINQLPFLTSSLVLTCFKAIELKQSVRAFGDMEFQRLQNITRMDPFELSESNELKDELFRLASEILTFVPDWEDNRINPNMMRTFARKMPAQEALDKYKESVKRQLQNDSIPFRIALSIDKQRTRTTNAEYGTASIQTIKALNKHLKEPSELVFFTGGMYECTMNDSDGRYNQSQIAFMLDLPTQNAVERFDAIPLWISPSGTQNFEFDQNNLPSRNELMHFGWKEITIGCAPERIVMARGGLQSTRLQHSLNHIGVITINKSQGETLPMGIAVEITRQYSPWEK